MVILIGDYWKLAAECRVRGRDYEKMSALLEEGASINRTFGKFAQHDTDQYVTDGPGDTPLTLAVRSEDIPLTEYLLKNGANPNVNYKNETLLMDASIHHNVMLVQLLLENGAAPDADNGRAIRSVFQGMRDWLLDRQEKPASEVVKLLLAHGFTGNPEDIVKNHSSDAIVNLFLKIYAEQSSDIDKTHEKDGVLNASTRKDTQDDETIDNCTSGTVLSEDQSKKDTSLIFKKYKELNVGVSGAVSNSDDKKDLGFK